MIRIVRALYRMKSEVEVCWEMLARVIEKWVSSCVIKLNMMCI